MLSPVVVWGGGPGKHNVVDEVGDPLCRGGRLFQAFEKSKALATQRMENPRIVPLAWYLEAWNEQQAILGPDPWEYGLTGRNGHTMQTIAGYSHEQGLTQRLWSARSGAASAGTSGGFRRCSR